MKHPNDKRDCFRLDVIDEEYSRVQSSLASSETLLQVITKPVDELVEMADAEALALATMLDQVKEFVQQSENRQKLETGYIATEEAPEFKVLPPHLKYSFLGGDIKKPVSLSSLLTVEERRGN